MARKPAPDQPRLPFDVPAEAPEVAAADAERASTEGRKVGRPRKWATEAERKRAYRERLAADLAEPQRLRRELRNKRRQAADKVDQLSRIQRELADARAEIARRDRRQADLQATVERLEARVIDWRSRAQELARTLEAERRDRVSPTAPTVAPRPPKKGSKRRRGR